MDPQYVLDWCIAKLICSRLEGFWTFSPIFYPVMIFCRGVKAWQRENEKNLKIQPRMILWESSDRRYVKELTRSVQTFSAKNLSWTELNSIQLAFSLRSELGDKEDCINTQCNTGKRCRLCFLSKQYVLNLWFCIALLPYPQNVHSF